MIGVTCYEESVIKSKGPVRRDEKEALQRIQLNAGQPGATLHGPSSVCGSRFFAASRPTVENRQKAASTRPPALRFASDSPLRFGGQIGLDSSTSLMKAVSAVIGDFQEL